MPDTNDNDIDALLAELRDQAANGYKTCQYAALTALVAERDGYLEGNKQTLRALEEANEIAKRYKRERDEANAHLRDACDEIARFRYEHSMIPISRLAEVVAEKRGWDCFEKEGGGA